MPTTKKSVWKPLGFAALIVLTLSAGANASAIKVWVNEVLRYTDLNANFAHLHNTMVGGHGARLVNADVSPTAAIAHSKLATPALIPKAFGIVGMPAGAVSACDGGAADGTACTVNASSRVTAVRSSAATGYYKVILAYTPTNAVFAPVVSGHSSGVQCNAEGAFSVLGTTANPHFHIHCKTASTGTDTNGAFSFTVFDNDN